MKFNDRLVRNRDFYKQGDKEAYDLLVELLKTVELQMGGRLAKMSNAIPSFEKAFWLPGNSEIADPNTARDNRIAGYEVVHQAMHVLVSLKYGSRLKGRPKITMLSEGLAGATELYFTAQFIRNGGSHTKTGCLSRYLDNSEALGVEFDKKINAAIRNPYLGFKQNALDSFRIASTLFEAMQLNRTEKAMDLNELFRSVRSVQHLVFLRHKDFGNFCLFVLNYCGASSRPQDLKDVRNCISVLDESDSLLDFLVKMGAIDIIESKIGQVA